MTGFTFRAMRIIEDTLNAVQQADELGGLDLEEYVRVMDYISKDLSERARCALDNLLEVA